MPSSESHRWSVRGLAFKPPATTRSENRGKLYGDQLSAYERRTKRLIPFVW